MIFLDNDRLYVHTEDCLQFLRELSTGTTNAKSRIVERYHLYWYGTFSLKQAFAVKSFLATQDHERAELWLWLDAENGYDDYQDNLFLRPFLCFMHVRRFDHKVEAQDTPLASRPDLYSKLNSTQRSDFFRFVVLYKYGGTYTDMDIMFLRDLSILHRNRCFQDEFCYRWSGHTSYANSAILRLKRQSETVHSLLLRCVEIGSCQPKNVLRFHENVDLNFQVLPCPFFDPLWPHYDHIDKYAAAPFSSFRDFFRKFSWWFHRKPTIRSYRDFFPGAFAYHWHNSWNALEHKDSYFGLFNQEFDNILLDKLGIEPP